jgi:protein transport protein SEC61 subunit gamma-like protein
MQDENKVDEELQEEVAEVEQAAEVEAPVESHSEQPKEELPKKLVDQPRQIGGPVPGKMEKLKAFIMECKRVLRVTKKPDKQEFTTIVKISAIGMAIIGVIGFLVHFVKELLF